jgi:hypothetical protein
MLQQRRQQAATIPEMDERMRIGAFWETYGNELEGEEEKVACKKVLAALRKHHGAISVGCMFALSYQAMVAIVEACGGARAWVTTIEKLFGLQFERLNPGAPESARAALTLSTQPTLKPGTNERAPRCEKDGAVRLGQELLSTGRIALMIDPPLDSYVGTVITETEDPENEQLSYLDTCAVVEENFKYMACVHNYVRGDKWVFKQLSKRCKQKKWKPYTMVGHPPATWFDKHKNRFKNGRKTIADKIYPKLCVTKENSVGVWHNPARARARALAHPRPLSHVPSPRALPLEPCPPPL